MFLQQGTMPYSLETQILSSSTLGKLLGLRNEQVDLGQKTNEAAQPRHC